MSDVRRVVMFVYNDALHDSRVAREADALAASGRDVLVVAHTRTGLPAEEQTRDWRLVRVGDLRAVRPGGDRSTRGRLRWLIEYGVGLREWSQAAADAAGSWAGTDGRVAWHGHDLTGMVAARTAHARSGGWLVYDSHELFVAAGTVARLPSAVRWLIGRLERSYVKRCDAVITVNDSIASALQRAYGVRPMVVMNCPPVPSEQPAHSTSPLRTTLGLSDRPVLLHHGGLSEGRGIEQTIDAMEHLSRDVALVILGNGSMTTAIRERAARSGGRIHHHPAVPVSELLDWVAGADVGVIAFQPVEENNVLATPNKLFECFAAGVPVVVSNFPEMSRIVNGHGVGRTCDPRDPRSIASAAAAILSGGRRAWAEACRRAALDRFSWEQQAQRLFEVYDDLPRGMQ
jgi:glycosyltransferase involved in cell wall biosynthesis